MDDPKYGTIQPEDIPLIVAPGVSGMYESFFFISSVYNKVKAHIST